MWLPVLDGANKAMKAVPYTYTTRNGNITKQTRRREKVGMEERTVEAASMFDVNKAINALFGKKFGDVWPWPVCLCRRGFAGRCCTAAGIRAAKAAETEIHQPEAGTAACALHLARCNQPIKRVKLKDGSIMQAAEFAATHEGMCADCYKATRLNVA